MLCDCQKSRHGSHVVADKGYDSQGLLQYCEHYGMQPMISLRKMHRKLPPKNMQQCSTPKSGRVKGKLAGVRNGILHKRSCPHESIDSLGHNGRAHTVYEQMQIGYRRESNARTDAHYPAGGR